MKMTSKKWLIRIAVSLVLLITLSVGLVIYVVATILADWTRPGGIYRDRTKAMTKTFQHRLESTLDRKPEEMHCDRLMRKERTEPSPCSMRVRTGIDISRAKEADFDRALQSGEWRKVRGGNLDLLVNAWEDVEEGNGGPYEWIELEVLVRNGKDAYFIHTWQAHMGCPPQEELHRFLYCLNMDPDAVWLSIYAAPYFRRGKWDSILEY